jgi:hypothetical protein
MICFSCQQHLLKYNISRKFVLTSNFKVTRHILSAPITGKQIAISGITIYRIANGKIIEAWEQLDLLGMWLQLGVISLPVGEKK